MKNAFGRVEQVAIIGGTSDIGLAIGRGLHEAGASRFILAGRNEASMRSSSEGLPGVSTVVLDAENFENHERTVSEIFADQDIDVVVLALGVLRPDPDADDIAEMQLVNGAATVSLMAHVAERLRTQGHGTLVVLSSIATVRPRPSNYWYGASKAPLDFAATELGREILGFGVQVLVVRPGFVRSKMTAGMAPAPLSCTPDDVANAVVSSIRQGDTGVVWVPPPLRLLASILRLLPHSVLARLDR